ncbi:MAG TPA: DsrE family protein [Coriobacteriia bacterium]
MSVKKVGFVVTHAADDSEMATLPFMLATGAMTMQVEPVIILQGEGVRLAVKGGAEAAAAEGLAPLADLLAGILGSGFRIMVCSPCMSTRGISEEQLLDGCFVGGAGQVVQSMLECENFLRY